MAKAKWESARRQLGRIAILERRMRQLVAKPYKTASNIAEISAIEWAVLLLEQAVASKFGDLPVRAKWHKHERQSMLAELWARDGDICYLCDKPLHYASTTVDHVIPLAKGGKDDIANYRLVHPGCNIEKCNMTFEQFKEFKSGQVVL